MIFRKTHTCIIYNILFKPLNGYPKTNKISIISDFSFTPELCENIFRRFNHSTSGELSFDEFLHSIITLQACYEKKLKIKIIKRALFC